MTIRCSFVAGLRQRPGPTASPRGGESICANAYARRRVHRRKLIIFYRRRINVEQYYRNYRHDNAYYSSRDYRPRRATAPRFAYRVSRASHRAHVIPTWTMKNAANVRFNRLYMGIKFDSDACVRTKSAFGRARERVRRLNASANTLDRLYCCYGARSLA